MGGEQRQAETPAHLLLPGPDRDSASDASTVWGLTGQVGGPSGASWVLTLACWALPRALGQHLPVAGVRRVGPQQDSATAGRRDVGTALSAQRTSSPVPGVKVTANPAPSRPCRRGSPLLIGVRSEYKLSTEQVPVLYMTCKSRSPAPGGVVPSSCLGGPQVAPDPEGSQAAEPGLRLSKSFFTLDTYTIIPSLGDGVPFRYMQAACPDSSGDLACSLCGRLNALAIWGSFTLFG